MLTSCFSALLAFFQLWCSLDRSSLMPYSCPFSSKHSESTVFGSPMLLQVVPSSYYCKICLLPTSQHRKTFFFPATMHVAWIEETYILSVVQRSCSSPVLLPCYFRCPLSYCRTYLFLEDGSLKAKLARSEGSCISIGQPPDVVNNLVIDDLPRVLSL